MDYFVVRYKGGEIGCPHHLSGELNQEQWEWDPFSPDPHSEIVEKDYVLKVSDTDVKTIGFDFYEAPSYYVSKKFLSVCDALGVNYRSIPLEIQILDRKITQSFRYYIFLTASSAALLDEKESEFSFETVVETGEVMINRYFKNFPMYSWINKFVPNAENHPALFRCIETMELVCSRDFKDLATRNNLQGISFIPIDENYKFDPWGECL